MNQITNEERRKVAEIMRNEAQLWHKLLPGTYINLGETSALLQDIMHFVGINGRAEPETIYNRLAGLINRPTCSIEYWGGGVFYLSCGHNVSGFKQPSFCPECGAEVVE